MAIKDGPEYTRYVAKRLIEYIDTPREERKLARREARAVREHWLPRWFGLAGTGVVLWLRSRRAKAIKNAGSDIQTTPQQHLVEADKA